MKSIRNIETLSEDDIKGIVSLAMKLKRGGHIAKSGKIKSVLAVFEDNDSFLKNALVAGAARLGISVIFTENVNFRTEQAIKDFAIVNSKMYDAIAYYGEQQDALNLLTDFAEVPVWNLQTRQSSPIKVLADLMTIREVCRKSFSKIKLCYIGDAKNSPVAVSLMVLAAKLGITFTVAAPYDCQPGELCMLFLSEKYGTDIMFTDDVELAARKADFLYTQSWLKNVDSLEMARKKMELLMPYRITEDVLQNSGNKKCRFMYSMPSYHQLHPEILKGLGSFEIECTDTLFYGESSLVFRQTENLMYIIEAICRMNYEC